MCPRKPLHLSPSSRLLYPPLPCNSLFVTLLAIFSICLPAFKFVSQLWTAASALQSFVSQLWTLQAVPISKNNTCLGSTVLSCFPVSVPALCRPELGESRVGTAQTDTATSWETNVRRLQVRGNGIQAKGGHSSPELGDKRKELQGKGGHSSGEVGDKCKRGRGGQQPRDMDTMTNKKADKRQGGHSDPQEARQDRRPRREKGDKADAITKKKGDKG